MLATGPLEALDRATQWLNSPPLTADRLRGRPVLVDFWTYSCVNWLRTLPYVRAWHEHYRDRGLVVVGVHAPEFGFEHDLANVRRAARDLDVPYPIVIDNDFAIWRAFDNQFWPALFLVGGDGRVRFRHFGEGAYEASEDAIRALAGDDEPAVSGVVDADGVALAADWDDLRSPETYVGRARGERRVDGDGPAATLALNAWTLRGAWTLGPERAELDAPPGAIAYKFQARDLNLVLAPPPSGTTVPFTVRLDGAPPGEDHGVDVDPAGDGAVAEPRMYQLVRQPTAGPPRTFEIAFGAAGVRAYVFTFG
jgi:thiol-disulfide isomerase/thioredoxin